MWVQKKNVNWNGQISFLYLFNKNNWLRNQFKIIITNNNIDISISTVIIIKN